MHSTPSTVSDFAHILLSIPHPHTLKGGVRDCKIEQRCNQATLQARFAGLPNWEGA